MTKSQNGLFTIPSGMDLGRQAAYNTSAYDDKTNETGRQITAA
jgi:hypothetical protein